jgi:hypothetical protein
VVAGNGAVRRAGSVEHGEGLADRRYLVPQAVLGQVTEVRQEDDVVLDLAVQDELQRGVHRRRVDRRVVEQVLRVGHDDEREARAVRVRLPRRYRRRRRRCGRCRGTSRASSCSPWPRCAPARLRWGFGLDSLIEIAARTVMLWELSSTGAQRQRPAPVSTRRSSRWRDYRLRRQLPQLDRGRRLTPARPRHGVICGADLSA